MKSNHALDKIQVAVIYSHATLVAEVRVLLIEGYL